MKNYCNNGLNNTDFSKMHFLELAQVTEPTSVRIIFTNRQNMTDVTEVDLYSDCKEKELLELWKTLHEEMNADFDAICSIDVCGCILN